LLFLCLWPLQIFLIFCATLVSKENNLLVFFRTSLFSFLYISYHEFHTSFLPYSFRRRYFSVLSLFLHLSFLPRYVLPYSYVFSWVRVIFKQRNSTSDWLFVYKTAGLFVEDIWLYLFLISKIVVDKYE
jgi:hypothetical protein